MNVPDEGAKAVKVPVVLLAQKSRADPLVGTIPVPHLLLLIPTLNQLLIILLAAPSRRHERAAFSR
jgi:hypothetical protein